MTLCAGINKNRYDTMEKNAEEALHLMPLATCGIAATGLVVVFGLYRNLTKPNFIKIIWAFITLGLLS